MVSITHRRGAGRRGLAAVPTDTAARHHSQLRLTTGQQEYLTRHGFGPDAPRADFSDPLVRAHFVELLRECGVLAPATVTPLPTSRTRRHLRRAG
jgi:hypothetical protein